MIVANDVVTIDVTPEELAECKAHPVPGCAKVSTGQLKAVGNLVLRKLLGVTQDAFAQQSDAAAEMGASYVCEVKDHELVGISPTVSVIHDDAVTQKRVIVPASQLFRPCNLQRHYTVGIMLKGTTNDRQELETLDQAYVAGWIPTKMLKRWVKSGGTPPFTVDKASLAVAPCSVLIPTSRLLNEVRWQRYCT